jgi:hypothetical protein|uniref:Uncharacterized protein n=1 Tax=viral metagenome TaxID=1070528 RepID=A0A6C0J358_9ZZZZ
MANLNPYTRPINYNEGSYKSDLLQSMKPGKYMTDNNYANRLRPRRIEDIGFVSSQGASLSNNKPLIDIDSELRFQYQATRDPTKMFTPNFDHLDNNINFCPSKFGVDYTRYTNPNILAPKIAKNRFEPFYLNPQDNTRWKTPHFTGVQSRWEGR